MENNETQNLENAENNEKIENEVSANDNEKKSEPVEIPEKLTQQQALQVLIEAARVSQSKGIFTLDDAELVNKAIRAFIPQGPIPSK